MRLMPSFHFSYADVSAARVTLAAAAVAGLIVLAACTDSAGKAVTAPQSIRAATIGSGGFGQAKILQLCVDANAPAGTYTFKNDELNRSFAQDSWNNALSGNGFFDGTFWNDPGDGGNGTTVQNALEDVNYTLSPGGCVNVLTRTSGDVAFMAKLPIAQGGTCNPATQSCGGVADAFAAANILFISASNGYLYDHTDCLIDNGDLMPEHINPTAGNPPVAIVPWPTGGYDGSAAFTNYGCGTSNNPTRAFANFEHGVKLTFFFHAPTTSTGVIAPTATSCTDYAKGLNSTLSEILVGFKNTKINSVSPGVFFYYAQITKGAGETVAFTQDVNPNPGSLPKYTIHQTQAYLYTFDGSTCTTVATLTLSNAGTVASGGSSLPAGDYILGVKFGTDAPKGTTVNNAALRVSGALLATHNFEATVGGSADASTTASVDTKTK